MRSEMRLPMVSIPVRARAKERSGAVLTASLSVLCVEAVIALIVNFAWEQTRESPALPHNALEIAALVIGAPFLAAVGSLVTVGVVIPLLAAAARLGRAVSGREAWWWVPAATAAATAPPVLAALTFTEAGVLVCLGGWLVATTALAAPALTVRRLLLPDRPPLSGRVMFGRVALYGTLAVVTVFTLAGVALSSGLAYEIPRLTSEQIAGTYSDGKGGTLVLTPDGKAVATRVDTFDFDGSFEPRVHPCTGTGSWTYDPGDGAYAQEVDVTVDSCPVDMDDWSVYGTREHPKLYVFIGDPDSWDLYTLRHTQGLPARG
ncbi:hypothetical protein ACFVQ4_22195 [Streptomyces laurentii]|uniref:hypothetical protein n=1 Tax=Streptomyces laurentii TaxID=39478 RepID=UPI00367E7109